MDKVKLREELTREAENLPSTEIMEKIDTTRQTQLDMLFTFGSVEFVSIGEEIINNYQETLKERNEEYTGKSEEFLDKYYALAETMAEDYNQFQELLGAIGEKVERE